MFKKSIIFLGLFLFIGCSSAPLIKIIWQGQLIRDTEEINYLYWREGVQFLVQNNDSVDVSFAGFSHENYVYILAALSNDTQRPITYFPQKSILAYRSDKEKVELKPIKPKNLDTDHFSFFNTVLIGAGSISRLFINLPVDMLIPDGKDEEDPLSHIGQDYHDEDIRVTKKIFISNHTLQPEDKFAGFLVFEIDDDLEPDNNEIIFKLVFDAKEFEGKGFFEL